MSTSKKSPTTIRQGGPGASKENAKAPLEIPKGQPDGDERSRSKVSSGGGEHDTHHTHDARRK